MVGSRFLPTTVWLRSCGIRDALGEGKRESVWKQGSVFSPWPCPEVAQSLSCSKPVLLSIIPSSCLDRLAGFPDVLMFQPASGVELEKERETGPHTAVFQAHGQRVFLPDFHGIPAPVQKLFHQGMTQAETSRHCKACEQTVRCHTTAAMPWALPQLPPSSQTFIVPRVHFTCFGPQMCLAAQTSHTTSCVCTRGIWGNCPRGLWTQVQGQGAPGRALCRIHLGKRVGLGAPGCWQSAEQQLHSW